MKWEKRLAWEEKAETNNDLQVRRETSYAPWFTGAWLVMSAGRKQEKKEPKEASRFR